jgi:hypothetical protein
LALALISKRDSERESNERMGAIQAIHRAGNRINEARKEYLYKPGPTNIAALHRVAGETLAVLEKYASLGQDLPDLFLYRAHALEAIGDFPGAMAQYDEGIGRFPRHVDLRLARVHLTFELANVFW